jgi:integrase
MSKANLYLKEPKADSPTLIYLFLSYDNKRLKYSTGESIHPKFWNLKTQLVKRSYSGYSELNARLEKLCEDAKAALRKLKATGNEFSIETLKNELKKLDKPNEGKDLNLLMFIEKFIENSKVLKRPNTIRNYVQTFNVLKEYKTKRNIQLEFKSINLNFYSDFISFLTHFKGLSNNTIGSHIKNIKVFMNEAIERDLTKNMDHKKKGFKTLEEQVDNIYLSFEEIENLYKFDFSSEKSLEMVRDLFVVSCYTGLRFSDFSQVQPGNFTSRNTIRIRAVKTDDIVETPIHPIVREIINKYNGKLPQCLAQPVMNRYLKIIGERIGLTEVISTQKTTKGILKKEDKKKYELITTHTGRRSFATNLYLERFPTISIMKITGHKTEKSFIKYIKASTEEHAQLLSNYWSK